jgi:hypothetical protein
MEEDAVVEHHLLDLLVVLFSLEVVIVFHHVALLGCKSVQARFQRAFIEPTSVWG